MRASWRNDDDEFGGWMMTTISDQCRSVAPHMESRVMVVPHMVPVRMDRGPRTGRPRMGRVARNTVVRPRAAHHLVRLQLATFVCRSGIELLIWFFIRFVRLRQVQRKIRQGHY